ncbi:hypothetical protein BS78_06G123600 [Paspalum vaginatum]|nr:hypothetical protein BS78_06G123600 [Paspalum vaginatum]
MPPICMCKNILNNIYKRVSPAVVSVNTYSSSNYTIDFATGFIVYSDKRQSVVCVHKSVAKGKKELYVHFHDGNTEKATVLLEGHAVLLTESKQSRARSVVSFRQCEAKREEIFTIAEVEGGYNGFNFMTGTVISPSCKVMDERMRKVIPESENIFAFTCPAVSLRPKEKCSQQVIGAAVFDLDGLVIGTINSLGAPYDLKLAKQACHWIDGLVALLKAKSKRFSLSKVKKSSFRLSGLKKRWTSDEDPLHKRKLQNLYSLMAVERKVQYKNSSEQRTGAIDDTVESSTNTVRGLRYSDKVIKTPTRTL